MVPRSIIVVVFLFSLLVSYPSNSSAGEINESSSVVLIPVSQRINTPAKLVDYVENKNDLRLVEIIDFENALSFGGGSSGPMFALVPGTLTLTSTTLTFAEFALAMEGFLAGAGSVLVGIGQGALIAGAYALGITIIAVPVAIAWVYFFTRYVVPYLPSQRMLHRPRINTDPTYHPEMAALRLRKTIIDAIAMQNMNNTPDLATASALLGTSVLFAQSSDGAETDSEEAPAGESGGETVDEPGEGGLVGGDADVVGGIVEDIERDDPDLVEKARQGDPQAQAELKRRIEAGIDALPTPGETEDALRQAIQDDDFLVTQLRLWKLRKEMDEAEGVTGELEKASDIVGDVCDEHPDLLERVLDGDEEAAVEIERLAGEKIDELPIGERAGVRENVEGVLEGMQVDDFTLEPSPGYFGRLLTVWELQAELDQRESGGELAE